MLGSGGNPRAQNVSAVCILDPMILITGVQSVFEPRRELVAPNCEILKDFQRFSQHLRVFHGFSERLD